MKIIKQPNNIKFGLGAAKDFRFPEKSLVITSKGASSRGWLNYTNLEKQKCFHDVEPNPSLDTAKKIISNFKNANIECIIGLGGGSSLDVAKFVGHKLGKKKILIPTTFGSGSEVTRIAVLTVKGKKTSFHDDEMFADTAIVDPHFIKNSPIEVIKNSAIDACAQCTEGYDSKLGNDLTRTLCKQAFDVLYDAIMNDKPENYPYGSMISGMGFGNCSTTLGHALSYVFSNEGVAHGFSLSSCTTIAHKHNNSIFYEKFKQVIEKLGFDKMELKAPVDEAADVVMTDKGHLNPNPIPISKEDVIKCLNAINDGNL